MKYSCLNGLTVLWDTLQIAISRIRVMTNKNWIYSLHIIQSIDFANHCICEFSIYLNIATSYCDIRSTVFFLMHTLLGYLGGLHLVLNAEQYDYVFYDVGDPSGAAGYLVNIHDPNTQELRPSDNGYFAPAGSTTRISLQKERVCDV